ncbi:tail terminator [Gordonia phage Mollymur]|uniref:Tail terminator n=1 Tax=Gordonia phage Mollymur TaxID=2590895 RepID=A0A4Y6EJ94_9CAUD|nr:tail terminator [Gordonia phage Mollymur]QDF15384.1 tail terminator [Gordonia phage Mollymur]
MTLPDVELLIEQHLSDLVYTDTALPEPPWDDIYPMAVYNRLPAGGVDKDGLADSALVGFLIIGETRADAQAAARNVVDALLNDGDPYEIHLDGTDWLVELVEQVSGGANELDVNPDNRFVELSFWIHISLRD